MLKVYNTIKKVFDTRFVDSSRQFKRGFTTCLYFLKIGITKQPTYSMHVLLENQARETRKTRTENSKLRKEISVLKRQLGQSELSSKYPLDYIKEYELESKFGPFRLAVNAEKETLLVMWSQFSMTNSYKTADECKHKFLNHLKKLSPQDFVAFKDLKTAKKELTYDNNK